MRDKIILLVERHCQTIKDEGNDIATCLRDCDSRQDDADLERAIYLVHKIKGSSGSLGFLPLSQTAQDLEDTLRSVVATDDRTEGLTKLKQLGALIQQQIANMTPEGSSLLEKFPEATS